MTHFSTKIAHSLEGINVLEGPEVKESVSGYWDTEINSQLLMLPKSTDEVADCLRLCNQSKTSVVAIGGLTGCVHGCDHDENHVLLSLKHMNKIEEIDTVGLTMTVQAGCTLQTVQEKAAKLGLVFPLDLGARGSCTIGGNTASNAGGIQVIRHGMIRSRILGLEAVMADGTVISSMNRMLKNNAGYDLKQLFIGSEGTLGVVTRVILKLEEAPSARNTAMVALESFSKTLTFLKHASQKLGGNLCAFEVMWQNYYSLVTEAGGHRRPLSDTYKYYVLIETEGSDQEENSKRFEHTLETALETELITDATIAQSLTEREALWAIREDIEPCVALEPSYLYDISIALKYMEEYVDLITDQFLGSYPKGQLYVLGHIGDGNLHLFIHPDTVDLNTRDNVDRIVYENLGPYQGSISAEHGIGLEKKKYLSYCRNEAEIALMRTLKQTMDPNNILNPGKVIDCP